jgi:ribosomal protein S18 acetylase RimI-like enzyme
MESTLDVRIRAARSADAQFILDLVPRFVAFDLPEWRDRDESANGVRRDIELHLRERPDGTHFFVAVTGEDSPAGFLHLQETKDFLTGAPNCHISDLAVAPGMDGRGVGSRLLAFAETWAKQRGCRFITLGVFPGNARARALYERHGYGVELLRMAKSVI